jgi:hypothetical protein
LEVGLIDKYEDKPENQVGFFYSHSFKGRVFVIGKDQVLSGDDNITEDILKNYNIVWIGSDAGEKYFVEDEVDNKKEFLLLMDNLHEFHSENFGAILLTLWWLSSAINIEEFNKAEVQVPSASFIGPNMSGKSTAMAWKRHFSPAVR